jgi:hypothetical protein
MFTQGQVIKHEWQNPGGVRVGGTYEVIEPLEENKCRAKCMDSWHQRASEPRYPGTTTGSEVELTYHPEIREYSVLPK